MFPISINCNFKRRVALTLGHFSRVVNERNREALESNKKYKRSLGSNPQVKWYNPSIDIGSKWEVSGGRGWF
jgi:hypothetical protein